MSSSFYNEDAPMPFRGIIEEEPEIPGRKRWRVLFAGGMPGPIGSSYSGGPVYPVIMGPEEDYDEEDEDPNP